MTARSRRTRDFLQLVEVAAAALVGGLLAMLVLAILGDLQPIMLFVVMVVALLAVLTVGSLQTSPPPPRPQEKDQVFQLDPLRPHTNWYGDAEASAAGQGSGWPPPTSPPPAPPQALPTFAPPLALPPPPAAHERDPDIVPVPGVRHVSHPPVRRIVQCPHCGSFEVKLVCQRGEGLTFACPRPHHEWTWKRGEPWPATIVRPAEAPVTETDSV